MSRYNPKLKRKPKNQKHAEARTVHLHVEPKPHVTVVVSKHEQFVKVPLDEYTGLVANNALMIAVKRFIEMDKYDKHDDLRTVLGMPSDDK